MNPAILSPKTTAYRVPLDHLKARTRPHAQNPSPFGLYPDCPDLHGSYAPRRRGQRPANDLRNQNPFLLRVGYGPVKLADLLPPPSTAPADATRTVRVIEGVRLPAPSIVIPVHGLGDLKADAADLRPNHPQRSSWSLRWAESRRFFRYHLERQRG